MWVEWSMIAINASACRTVLPPPSQPPVGVTLKSARVPMVQQLPTIVSVQTTIVYLLSQTVPCSALNYLHYFSNVKFSSKHEDLSPLWLWKGQSMMILGPSQCLEVQPSTPGISACPKGDTTHTCIQMFRAPAQILSEALQHYYNGDQASSPIKYRKHG